LADIRDSRTVPATVPPRFDVQQAITIKAPATGTRRLLVLKAQTGGATLFEDDAESFTLN
jgi:hypothetical protein